MRITSYIVQKKKNVTNPNFKCSFLTIYISDQQREENKMQVKKNMKDSATFFFY